MSVCIHRPESPGFFTACASVTGNGSCRCGAEVAAELAETDTEEAR